MSKNQIDELFERVIKELLEEYEKEKPKESKNEYISMKDLISMKELISFDMALNYILAEYRKGNTEAKIRRDSMPKGDFIQVMDCSPAWSPFLSYYSCEKKEKKPYNPNANSIFANDWDVIG